MAVPIMTPNGTLGLVYVDRGHGKKRFQTHDLDLLTTFASIISGKLHAILEQQQQRTSRVAQIEGELVQRLQTLLEPAVSPTWKNLRMSVYTRGGQENPGDICDVIKHPDSELTGFLLGHVTASGAQLALAMARLHSTFRVGFLHNDPPHALLRTINWLAENEENPPMLEAMVFQIDPTSGKFRFSRAGRIGSFIVTPQGVPRQVKGADGPAIGRVSNYEYISKADELKPGESLALYTRGVATTINADGERFSEKRFIELVCDGFGQSPSATIQDISDELAAFFTDGAHPDDISILLLQRTS
jgi:serine phosphatase RsbU (regulator of sigma subunit)